MIEFNSKLLRPDNSLKEDIIADYIQFLIVCNFDSIHQMQNQ